MILKLVFRSLEGRCRGKKFVQVLSTELIFMTPVASGEAGRANVRLCSAPSFYLFTTFIIHCSLTLSLLALNPSASDTLLRCFPQDSIVRMGYGSIT